MYTHDRTTGRRAELGRRLWGAALAGALVLGGVSATGAAGTPEQKCQYARAKVAGKYAYCQQKALAKWYLTGDFASHSMAAGKCVTLYAATWPTLVAKAAGSTTCVDPRFTDNGSTVTDRLTGLEWEKKNSLGSGANLFNPHDADNVYWWSTLADGDFTDADGTAFTSFLFALNSGGCFQGQCDWRLPTWDELLTIVTPAYPACTSSPCIDPIFGPTVESPYWSASTDAYNPDNAWSVAFGNGHVFYANKGHVVIYVRGVRSGL